MNTPPRPRTVSRPIDSSRIHTLRCPACDGRIQATALGASCTRCEWNFTVEHLEKMLAATEVLVPELIGNRRCCRQCDRSFAPVEFALLGDNAAVLAAWLAGFCSRLCSEGHAVMSMQQGKAWWLRSAGSVR
jgi:hypothetical protein